jgi:hypothetical protein
VLAGVLVAFGYQARRQRRPHLHLRLVAPATERLHGLDHPLERGLGAVVDGGRRRGDPGREQPFSTGHVGVYLLGHERDDGMRECDRLKQHV